MFLIEGLVVTHFHGATARANGREPDQQGVQREGL